MNLADIATSNARANARAILKRGDVALARKSTTGRGVSIQSRKPDADLYDLLADGWQVVEEDNKENTDAKDNSSS